ncbi:MAG: tetratricopeptide repeat protein [Bacteroidota bacterium]
MKKIILLFLVIAFSAFVLNAQTPQLKRSSPKAKPTVPSIKKSTGKSSKQLAEIKQWEEVMISAGNNEQYDTVEVYAGKILSKDNANAMALYELGNAFKQRRIKLDSAKVLFEMTIRYTPTHFRAYGDLAVLLEEGGNTVQAIEMARKGIELGTSESGNVAIAYKNLGGYFIKTMQYDSAIVAYNNAIRINPQYVNAYYDLGYANSKLKLYADAADAFEHVIDLAPNDESLKFSSLKYLAWYYGGEKGSNMTKAVKYAELGVKMNPGEEEFVFVLADKYQSDGNWYGYLEVYKGLSNANQNDNKAPQAVAYAYQQLGNQTDALVWLKIAARRGNETAQNALRNAGVDW